MGNVLAIDATGLHALESVASRFHSRGAALLISGVQPQPLAAMQRSGTLDLIGRDMLFATFAGAVAQARTMVNNSDTSG
jgi:SulP family sulfate permease